MAFSSSAFLPAGFKPSNSWFLASLRFNGVSKGLECLMDCKESVYECSETQDD
jgi:hypothetical protein